MLEALSSGGIPGQAASVLSSTVEARVLQGALQPSLGDSGQVTPVSFYPSVLDEASAVAVLPLGGGPMQVGSDPPSPAAWSALEVAVSPSRGGSGQEASGPYSLGAPMVAAPPVLGGSSGR